MQGIESNTQKSKLKGISKVFAMTRKIDLLCRAPFEVTDMLKFNIVYGTAVFDSVAHEQRRLFSKPTPEVILDLGKVCDNPLKWIAPGNTDVDP